MPRKFQLKEIAGEIPEVTERRKEFSIERVKFEIDCMKIYMRTQEKKFLDIDAEFTVQIQQRFPDIADLLISQWAKDCSEEEQTSIERYKKHETFYIENGTSGFKNNLQQTIENKSTAESDEIKENYKGNYDKFDNPRRYDRNDENRYGGHNNYRKNRYYNKN